MIKINEDKEDIIKALGILQKKLIDNGYKEENKGYFSKVYFIGKSLENTELKPSSKRFALGKISINHEITIKVNTIDWSIYFNGKEREGALLWRKDVPDSLVEQFHKSSEILYNSIRKSRVHISAISPMPLKIDSFFAFGIHADNLSINKGIEGVEKLLKALPQIVRRIDLILKVKPKGRI